jgi:hypothetical protein
MQEFKCNSDLCDFFKRTAVEAVDKTRTKANSLIHAVAANSSLEVELRALRHDNKVLKVSSVDAR